MAGLQGAAAVAVDDSDFETPEAPEASPHASSFDRGPAFKLIERDLGEAHAVAQRASHEMKRSAEGQIQGAKQVSDLAGSVGSVAASFARGAKEMAVALDDIRTSSSAISAHVARANSMTASATEKTARAEDAVTELGRVAEQIAGVIELVSYIAQQTTMLSHNANIQAARAGEEGRGFAVIALEVRKLSEDTRAATETVQKQIAALRAASQSCRDSVSMVTAEVKNTAQLCASIDDSARSQLTSVAQLSASAAESARDAEALSEQSRSLQQIAADSLAAAELIASQSSTTDDALGKLHDNLFILTTQTRERDPDDLDMRRPILLRCALSVGPLNFSGETIEFGMDGAILRLPQADEELEGEKALCRVEKIGALHTEILRVDKLGVHVRFHRASDGIAEAARKAMREENERMAPLIARATQGAFAISRAMEQALSDRLLTETQLFDTNYRVISGTNPVQYSNAAVHTLEKLLTPIQEAILAKDDKLAFCCAVDLNAYLPVHNKRYSQPQKANDVVWNTANCRNKRIFADRAGLAAARNTHPHLVQFYARDMGGGKFVMMKEIDAPVVVNGRHWGGFRTSYSI
ncbi:methyl-accepting chemotaxis protein [Terrarubrum flagellatum]|uniref:methyl-accepting chemotaxis protein n=1 Tax=Terrirubrum flagellatum TaxID=2895980 RepID=UPI0031455093